MEGREIVGSSVVDMLGTREWLDGPDWVLRLRWVLGVDMLRFLRVYDS
jgi:hypothetical protein